MTDALPLATTIPANQRAPLSSADLASNHHNNSLPSLQTEETADDDDGEIACICAFTGDDGNTIQCDKCLRWQHISCYYPPPKEVPGEDQKHYCTDCVPQDGLDSRKAAERQRRLLDQQRNGVNGVKRPAAKPNKKKVKDSPSLSAQPNGWPERHSHLQNHDRKSASPRDQPPPAKKPKVSHRSSNSISNPSGRKRAGTVNANPTRSPSKSPELNLSTFIPQYSEEFLHLFQPQSPQVETDTNLMNNIAVTNLLSDWLQVPDAVGRVTGGLTQGEIFKRWDGQMDDIPGRPEVSLEWVEDQRFTSDGMTPRWARLTVEEQIAQGTFIGELRGRVGIKDDYIHESDGRWGILHHPEPFVFFHPQLPICIDARQEGSIFRFVRRSCQPNAELQTIITEGTEYHFCFMAKRDILAGEEVTVAWQVPDTIRDRINSSLATSNNFQPKVRDYISTWVSNVLSNCGPCACNNQSTCLMAHYDRRGLSPPLQPAKTSKRKKKLPMLEPVATSRSRSASEVRKTEQDEDASESRSISESRGSVSRDITPSTHYSVVASTQGFQELSERERKKLMREEEMFRRQEAESGRQRKKRNSGGSTLNTPSAPPSVRGPLLDGGKRSEYKSNGTSARHADAGTSSRPQLPSRTSSGKRRTGPSTKGQRKESASLKRPTSADYIDVGIQCDLDQHPVPSLVNRPRKRYVSVAQRLLQRCISKHFKADEPTAQIVAPVETDKDAMDIDTAEPVPAEASAVNGESTTELKTEDADTVMADVSEVETKTTPTVKTRSRASAAQKAPEPSAVEADTASQTDTNMADDATFQAAAQVESEATIEAPAASVATDTATTSVLAEPPKDASSEKPVPAADVSHADTRPTMHLDMPPPHLSFTAPQATMSGALVQSPSAVTPGQGASMVASLFSPSVTTAVSPSPVRKKLSLSDYTKRSRARESQGGEATGPSSLAKEVKEEASPVSATALTPTREANAAKPADEEAIADDTPPPGKGSTDGNATQDAASKSESEGKEAEAAPAEGSTVAGNDS